MMLNEYGVDNGYGVHRTHRIFTLVNRRVKGKGGNDDKEVKMILADGMLIASMNDQV